MGGKFSQTTIQEGFNSTGIFPCSREKYPKHRLDPTKLEKYNSIIRPTEAETVSSPPVRELEPIAGPSDASDGPAPINCSPVQNDEQKGIAFAELLQKIKKTTPIPEKRRMIERHSEVVTSEEYMSLVKNKSKNSKNGRPIPVGKGKTKTVQKKKKVVSDSETSEDEEWQESGDSLDGIELLEEESEMCELSESKEMKVGDYMLVKFTGGKRKTVVYKYVSVVQKCYPVCNEYDVMCMNISGNKTLFKLNEADVTLVHKTDIIGVLPVPFMSCIGQHMQYCFPQPVDVFEK